VDELIEAKFEFKCDEDGVGWHILKGRLLREDWSAVKRNFEYLKDDFFIEGWVTGSPKAVAQILIERGVWRLT
jgi:hypothetical protein